VKLRIADGTAEEQGVFQHRTGFRFTSHVVFQTGNREYLCTIGQPNRLFLIDAESMELVAFKDLGPNRLSSETDLLPYVSSAKVAEGAIAALSVSEDGKYLAVARTDGVAVVDLGSMNIIDSLPVMASLCRLAGRAVGEIFHDAAHCQRLR
jgi:aminoglycoside phosphotransferase